MPHLLRSVAMAAATAACCSVHATDIALTTRPADANYGAWAQFNVSDIDSQSFDLEWIDNANTNSPGFGTPLTFSFTVATGTLATLTVVDGGFAGDVYEVRNGVDVLGLTTPVHNTELHDIGLDFDAALADPHFSHGVYTLTAGAYRVGGVLVQSFLLDGVPLDSTVGAVRLTVAAIPEPASAALLLAGLGVLGAALGLRR